MPRMKKPAGVTVKASNGAELIPADTRDVDFRRVPKPPAGVRPEVHPLWKAYWLDPIANTFSRADIGALNRWAFAWSRYLDAQEAFDAEPMIVGSMGQDVLSPWHTVMVSAANALDKAEAALGLNPLARARLGVTLGEAKKSLEDHAKDAASSKPKIVEVRVTEQTVEVDDVEDPRLA